MMILLCSVGCDLNRWLQYLRYPVSKSTYIQGKNLFDLDASNHLWSSRKRFWQESGQFMDNGSLFHHTILVLVLSGESSYHNHSFDKRCRNSSTAIQSPYTNNGSALTCTAEFQVLQEAIGYAGNCLDFPGELPVLIQTIQITNWKWGYLTLSLHWKLN